MAIEMIKVIPCKCEGNEPFCETCGGSGRLRAEKDPFDSKSFHSNKYTNEKQVINNFDIVNKWLIESGILQSKLMITFKKDGFIYTIV
ncbi:hypothetical protein [Bacillus solimangrovi]|uniref:Uncharacterized protein n=1 Tax=Bacillus solimangrovi TaxID=1305675 RepID=A0A1E5LF18_9BACI|nr:hypothetical protein [Bacillus solimangrovi]OEH92664.1 hypothetical protein BFG57_01270 [Bacillus solimangrovi]